jgi:hypothetical protein
MATSPKSLPRDAKRRPQSRKKAPAQPISAEEKQFLRISMGLLDAMPDDQYRKASDKLERLVKRSRASS